ncbi:MAG: hypothetical protein AAGJ54_13095 [Planctomycetota bacterium]
MSKFQCATRAATVSAAVTLITLSGCGSGKISERYHFPGVRDGEVVNYYRVDVEGRVEGTQLRYVSGFFDEDALNRYFNTFSQADNGTLISYNDPEPNPEVSVAAGEERDPDPQKLNRKLVMLLSQNSEVVADEIGGLAQSEAFATVVSRLIFADEIAAVETEKLEAERYDELLGRLKAQAGEVADRLPGAAEPDAELLNFLNSVGAVLGSPPFRTINEARTWFNSNRSQLLEGVR